jgi:hypothetical protein
LVSYPNYKKMRILLDTNVLLNDFFHRNPDYGFQRINDADQARQVEAYRETVHEALLFLSLQAEVEVWTTTSILSRFAAILGDLLVPADLVAGELQHLMGNLKLVEVSAKDLEESLSLMGKASTKMDFDDYLLKHLATKNELDMVLSSVPKSREFYWPVLFFKPEKVRDITFGTKA